ncbi:MAG: hypothetical protein KFB96_21075 [Thiocapsa sp.]|uniref:hypothetical protein n=1 Tax=Thiocapsa sp. TaxID=2024551 RepID=UPI001BCBF252|nr:hypothetical protein [Thiocapsa sp.]QVL48111.1 MAG: hypothetical protein KFB96_21075 [Thiocapsa sp.]
MIEESPITDIAQIIQLAGAPMLLREVLLATAGLRFRRHLGHAGADALRAAIHGADDVACHRQG